MLRGPWIKLHSEWVPGFPLSWTHQTLPFQHQKTSKNTIPKTVHNMTTPCTQIHQCPWILLRFRVRGLHLGLKHHHIGGGGRGHDSARRGLAQRHHGLLGGRILDVHHSDGLGVAILSFAGQPRRPGSHGSNWTGHRATMNRMDPFEQRATANSWDRLDQDQDNQEKWSRLS